MCGVILTLSPHLEGGVFSMRKGGGILWIVLACQFVASSLAGAGEPFDVELAKEINMTCAGCHGEFGQGVADGTYPRLAGLDADYLARQMRLFKSRERLNIPMFPYATERELPEEDVLVISRYLASIELIDSLPPIDPKTYDPLERLKLARKVFAIPRFEGNVERGEKFYNKECASCHGRDGLGKRKKSHDTMSHGKEEGGGESPGKKAVIVYPRLAGQHSRYLLRQIKMIAAGKRFHDEEGDAALFAAFSSAQIKDVLAYLSLLDDL